MPIGLFAADFDAIADVLKRQKEAQIEYETPPLDRLHYLTLAFAELFEIDTEFDVVRFMSNAEPSEGV
jgi:hypothetical protein